MVSSVVHEYTVLWSTRISQRDKRWSDGMLRYYELNNKIEVLSDQNMIVATDFYPKSKSNPVTSGYFDNGHQVVLPGGRVVVEVDEYVGKYTRDVVFGRKSEVRAIAMGNLIERKEPEMRRERPRRIGLGRPRKALKLEAESAPTVKEEPVGLVRVKEEPFCLMTRVKAKATESVEPSPKRIRVKTEPDALETVKPEPTSQLAEPKSSPESLDTVLPRIAPRLSRHFRYMPQKSLSPPDTPQCNVSFVQPTESGAPNTTIDPTEEQFLSMVQDLRRRENV